MSAIEFDLLSVEHFLVDLRMLFIYLFFLAYLQSSHLSIFSRVLKSSVVCRVSGLAESLRVTSEKEIRKSRSVDPRAAEKKRSSLLLAERERE